MTSDDVTRIARDLCVERTSELTDSDSSHYLPEKYQLGIVAEWLESRGITYTTEAEVFCYPIDVVASKYEMTAAIELKSRNVGRGIEQALRNSDFVDYSYLSVWEDDITESLIKRVEHEQIGLIGVDENVHFHSLASQSSQQLCDKSAVLALTEQNVRGDTSVQQQSGQADD